MDPMLNEWLNILFRWAHVVAGVMWIGHLWFFNFVNAQVAKTYDADSKKKVVPELMPRALYWFRWGAMYTWVTGILLLGVVIYMGGVTVPLESTLGNWPATGVGLASIIAGFFVYDALWKTPIAKNEKLGMAVSFVLLAAAAFGYSRFLTGRAAFIHVGSLLGTIMFLNVWMRIWPSQRKIIAAIKGGTAPDPAIAALAGLRSKHNTYLSVPLMLLMVSNHYPTVYGNEVGWAIALGLVAFGWVVAKLLYLKSAQPAPATF